MNNVLFSAVGLTDPVRDYYDGPLLHIIRHYKPKKVYLFYTKEMSGKRQLIEDAIDKLSKRFEMIIHVEHIVTDIEKAHDFDIYAKEFGKIIDSIYKENPESQILLNISSGTTQMQSTLCLEVVSSHIKLKPIQVSSPTGRSNEGISHGGSAEENLDDLMENGEFIELNRCLEPNIAAFKRSWIKGNIIGLIESYEYRAASKLAENNPELFEDELLGLLKYAEQRQNDNQEYRKSKFHDQFNDTKDVNAQKAVDYFNILKNKAHTGELSYFVLLLKPLSEYIAACYLDNFTDEEAGKILDEYYRERFGDGFKPLKYREGKHMKISYNIEQYICLMNHQNKDKVVIEKFIRIKEEFLDDNRNLLAHGLKRIDNLNAQRAIKQTEDIIIAVYGNKVKKESFDVYNNINKVISQII